MDTFSRPYNVTLYPVAEAVLPVNSGWEEEGAVRLGRVYESRVYNIDPDDGTIGPFLPAYTWYDARGSVVRTDKGVGSL